MLDIDSWLRGIGLAQYVELFRSNDIDRTILRRLSVDDLKEIGVASRGHRKKLAAAPEAASSASASATAERRTPSSNLS